MNLEKPNHLNYNLEWRKYVTSSVGGRKYQLIMPNFYEPS